MEIQTTQTVHVRKATQSETLLQQKKLMLIDESLTPDTSRFWSMDRYRHGEPMPSMGKHILADFLGSLGMSEMISLPDEMLAMLGEKGPEVYKLITGKSFYSMKECLENYREATC